MVFATINRIFDDLWRSRFGPMFLGAATALPFGLSLFVSTPAPWPAAAADVSTVKACDQAVNALLTTDNLVDLERATFLIRELNCSVSSRLPH